jgi:hypothetical protein
MGLVLELGARLAQAGWFWLPACMDKEHWINALTTDEFLSSLLF